MKSDYTMAWAFSAFLSLVFTITGVTRIFQGHEIEGLLWLAMGELSDINRRLHMIQVRP